MTKQGAAAKSNRSKRRKQAEPAPADEDFYEIRDIVGEKRVKGKLLYKVDWADNPITGQRYDPSWEPAQNVTEAAVADWEKQKRQGQASKLESTPSSVVESDSQPVLPPNWRAKRRRDRSVTEASERSNKRARGSVDSGYTSPDPDGQADEQADWALVNSVPRSKGNIVLELSVPPGFDPSEYRAISLSQSTAHQSSQGIPSAVAASQNQSSGVTQKTVPDSQDWFESLRTQCTTRSAANFIEPELPIHASQTPAQEGEVQQTADIEQPSRSDHLPSRQPEASHQNSARSSGLLETHEIAAGSPAESLSRSSAFRLEHPLTSEESPWSRGFLTQPEYEPPAASVDDRSPPHSPRRSNQTDRQEQERSGEGATVPGADSSLSAESSPHSQAAQQISVLDSNAGQICTQVSQAAEGEEEVVPETVHREPRPRYQTADRSASESASAKETEPASSLTSSFGPARAASLPAGPLSQLQTRKMDTSPVGETPRSAVDIMRQLQAEMFGPQSESIAAEPRPGAALVSPSTLLPAEASATHTAPTSEPPSKEQPLSAVEGSSRSIDMSLDMPIEHPVGGSHSHGVEYERPPQTVAPSDLTAAADHFSGVDNDLSIGDRPILEGALPTIEDVEEKAEDDGNGRHFLVTLPMASNTRSTYLNTISENKATLIEFGEVFANSLSSMPDPALVAKVDSIFGRLLDLCDLPAYHDSLSGLGREEMMKHATNSNSKFSFVYEFLSGLRDINAHVLILSQPGPVFECLEAVVSAAGFPCIVLERGSALQPIEGLSVILAEAGQDLSKVQGGVDVVLVFDHTARSVELPASLGYEGEAPMVLSLVVTYSLEHIDQVLQQMEPDLDDLERKNALNLATAMVKERLRNPERGYPEPHHAAETFANFLRSPEGGLAWEPHPLPADVFELWVSSQERAQESQGEVPQTEVTGGRKRPLDDAEEGAAKRTRFLLGVQQPSRTTTPARMSDLLKRTLASHLVDIQATTQFAEVPVEQLERMADKIAELEARLATESAVSTTLDGHVTSLESQLRPFERTVQSIQRKYMDALRDRGTYETECKAAVEKEKAATERLEAQKSMIGTLKEENQALKSRLAEASTALANSTVPEAAKLAQSEMERDDALAKVEKLQNKIRNLEKELDYTRKAYQDASNAPVELNRENRELQARLADAEKRASENLLRIHQTHAKDEAAAASAQIGELQAALENRERELDRAKEELRLLKNSRRETRQASVPRSPRPGGVMSPRPGRGIGGAGSRGASPAPVPSSDGPGGGAAGGTPLPGMTFIPSANGGRWSHLRGPLGD